MDHEWVQNEDIARFTGQFEECVGLINKFRANPALLCTRRLIRRKQAL